MSDAPSAPAPSSAPGRGRRVVRVLVPILGLALLAFLLHRTGWRELGQAFRRIGWPTFAVLVGLGAVELGIDCEALRRAMLGRVGLGWTMASNAAGGLVNTVIPFEAGEVVKGALLRQRSTHSRVVSGLIVWNYAWKLAKPAAVAVCFVLGVGLGHVFRKDFQLPVLVGVALSFLPYLALRLLIRQRPAERLMRLLARVPRLRRRAEGGVQAAARLDGEVHSFYEHHPAAYLQVLGLTFVGRFMGLLALYLFARRLDLPTDLGSVAFLYASQTVIDYVAMLLPARVGMSEGSAYLLFQAFGMDPAIALVMLITLRARMLLVQGPLAIWAYLAGSGTQQPQSDGSNERKSL
jgi:hypothetical protein